jgi:hypothetical protein
MLISCLTLLSCLLPHFFQGATAGAHHIDPPDQNPGSTANQTIEAFTFRRARSYWRNQNIDLFDNKTHTKVMQIKTWVKYHYHMHFLAELTLLPSQEKLGVTVKVSPQCKNNNNVKKLPHNLDRISHNYLINTHTKPKTRYADTQTSLELGKKGRYTVLLDC